MMGTILIYGHMVGLCILWCAAGSIAVEFMELHYSLKGEKITRRKKALIRVLGLIYLIKSASILTKDLKTATSRLREIEAEAGEEGKDFLSASDLRSE